MSNPMINIEIKGIAQAVKHLQRKLADVENHTAKGMLQGGLLILRKSAQEVPLKTGNLRASGFIVFMGPRRSFITRQASRQTVFRAKGDAAFEAKVARTAENTSQNREVAKGDLSMLTKGNFGFVIAYSAEYAADQHETLTYHHPGGRKPHYLQDPTLNLADDVVRLMVASGRKALS